MSAQFSNSFKVWQGNRVLNKRNVKFTEIYWLSEINGASKMCVITEKFDKEIQ